MERKHYIIGGVILGVLLLLGALWWFTRKDLSNQIVIPFIAHQKPQVDPHLPHAVPLSNKLDEVLFDGLFNISANPSGVVFEDALGEFIDIYDNSEVVIRLKPNIKWHNSYNVALADKGEVTITEAQDVFFAAQDLNFTLKRIRDLGSLSPDYILVSQALESWDFEGPDNNNEIRFRFKDDRIWTETDIKTVLSFKIIPHTSDLSATNHYVGSGPYLAVAPTADVTNYFRNPAAITTIEQVKLNPFIDNSTFTTELSNGNINVLLDTPFGSLSPILADKEDYFVKSNISTTFFAVLFNTQRLGLAEREELRKLLNRKTILQRFFKVGTEQQRHITDYKGNSDNYDDYLNYSVFPSSSYYVDEEIVLPLRDNSAANVSILPDSIRIVANLNFGHREEYSEMIEILNDRSLFQGRIRAAAVDNATLKRGNYDAVLVAIDGYKSTFLFDLYKVFLRDPDLATSKITLVTETNSKGEIVAAPQSLNGSNFCRLDATKDSPEKENILQFLDYMYGFMYTNHIGDKQFYAQYFDELEQKMALGAWLFSMPSLAYFSTQFDNQTIDLYGVASQLSTIEKWQERRD